MNTNKNIDQLIEETLNSADGIQRATPKPFLLTRINARMNNTTASLWEKASWFITRPAVAFTGLCLIILINVTVLANTDALSTTNVAADTVAHNSTDEISTVATIYDIENTQP